MVLLGAFIVRSRGIAIAPGPAAEFTVGQSFGILLVDPNLEPKASLSEAEKRNLILSLAKAKSVEVTAVSGRQVTLRQEWPDEGKGSMIVMDAKALAKAMAAYEDPARPMTYDEKMRAIDHWKTLAHTCALEDTQKALEAISRGMTRPARRDCNAVADAEIQRIYPRFTRD